MDLRIFTERARNKVTEVAEDRVKYLSHFVRWTLMAIIMGLAAGLVGTAFHISVEMATEFRGEHSWLVWLLPVAGLVIVFLYRICGFEKDGGTNAILEAADSDGRIPILMAPLIFVSTVITHMFGGSAGREGAALQLGGCIASVFGRGFRLSDDSMQVMVRCGMSALFSALFGTPLAAAVFALEVISAGVLPLAGFVPCIISAITAYWVAGLFGVAPTTFALNVNIGITPLSCLQVLIIAVICALFSIFFCWFMKTSHHLLEHWFKNPYIRVFVGGLFIAVLTFLVGNSDYNGAGMNVITRAVAGEARPWDFLMKMLFTAVTIGAGYKGGEIVPTFYIGATLGCLIGPIIGMNAGYAAAVGTIAMFASVVNCPIASVFLAMEMFGDVDLRLFAIATSVCYMLSGYGGLYSSQKSIFSKVYVAKRKHLR